MSHLASLATLLESCQVMSISCIKWLTSWTRAYVWVKKDSKAHWIQSLHLVEKYFHTKPIDSSRASRPSLQLQLNYIQGEVIDSNMRSYLFLCSCPTCESIYIQHRHHPTWSKQDELQTWWKIANCIPCSVKGKGLSKQRHCSWIMYISVNWYIPNKWYLLYPLIKIVPDHTKQHQRILHYNSGVQLGQTRRYFQFLPITKKLLIYFHF